MNATARVILPATVCDIADGPYFYAACQQCYSKLLKFSNYFSCPKCGRSLPCDKVEYRYRLSMTISDSSAYVTITAFGGMLDAYFGCSASELGKRWMKKLQRFVGNMEQTVIKWAIEESMIGCHMYFGFKVHQNLLCKCKTHENNDISLKDIKEHCEESLNSLAYDRNLVAVQLIAQNDLQMPTPVTRYLQSVVSLCENTTEVNGEKELQQMQVQKFIQQHHTSKIQRNSKELSQPLSPMSMSKRCNSVFSLLEETSIAFSFSDSTTSTPNKLSKSLSEDSKGIRMPFTTTDEQSIFCECEKDYSRSSKLLYSTECVTSLHCTPNSGRITEENVLTNVEEEVGREGSILLFDSPDCNDRQKEMPRNYSDENRDLISNLPNDTFDISAIVDEDVAQISSDISHLSMNMWVLKTSNSVSAPTFQSIENEYEICTPQKDCVLNNYCEADCSQGCVCLIDVHEDACLQKDVETSMCTKKHAIDKFMMEETSVSLLDSKENEILCNDEMRGRLIEGNPMISCHSTPAADHYSLFLDMPESEDLDLFLAVAKNSFDEQNIRVISRNSSPTPESMEETSSEKKESLYSPELCDKTNPNTLPSVLEEFDSGEHAISQANTVISHHNCSVGIGIESREPNKNFSVNCDGIFKVRSEGTTLGIIQSKMETFQIKSKMDDEHDRSHLESLPNQSKHVLKPSRHLIDTFASNQKQHTADLVLKIKDFASSIDSDTREQGPGEKLADLMSFQKAKHYTESSFNLDSYALSIDSDTGEQGLEYVSKDLFSFEISKSKHDAELTFILDTNASSSDSDDGEQNQRDNSVDLFSSQESNHSHILCGMKELSTKEKTVSLMSNTGSPVTSKMNEKVIIRESGRHYDDAQNQFQLNSCLFQDHSFDLFSSPDS